MADVREIPGFYYDAEKKKYFRVLPNHVAPQGAKYSQESVKKEKVQAKKRKRTAVFQQKKEARTVRRSAILASPTVAGISLLGEQGSSRSHVFEARNVAYARESRKSSVLSMRTCESCGRRDKISDFVIDKATGGIIWGLGAHNMGRLQYITGPETSYDIAAFRSEISSISVTHNRVLVATAMSSGAPGDVYVARLAEPTLDPLQTIIEDIPAPSYTMLGNPEESLWASSPSPRGGRDFIMIGGSEQAYMLSSDGQVAQTYAVGDDVRSVAWLSPNVAFGGTRVARSVLLFDARTGGSSARFHHSSGVTGVRGLENEHQMLVCGFKGMSIYDVRMPGVAREKYRAGRTPSRALMRLAHETQYPSTVLDVWPQAHLVAVADDDNVIHLHSLPSGKSVGRLGIPQSVREADRISQLRVGEKGVGTEPPTILVSQGSVLSEWGWGGCKDDEA